MDHMGHVELEATWLSCFSPSGTGGVTNHVTSVVIPLVLSGLQGCAKSVLRWEITRDSPDATQRFASDSVNSDISACESTWDRSAGAAFFQINQSKSPACYLSVNDSIFFHNESQSQLWRAGGNWASSINLTLSLFFFPLLGGIAAAFSSWSVPSLCVCLQGDFSLLKYFRLKQD